MYKFRYNNKEFDFHEPRIMAIINLTPDSFYDGGKYANFSVLMREVEQKLEQGAYILDLGAQSTRPGAVMKSAEEEWQRLEKPLSEIRKRFPEIIISIDTFNALTARRSLEYGADMINDVSGMKWDPDLLRVIEDYKCPYVLMHSKGTPDVMQSESRYENVTEEINLYFINQTAMLKSKGIPNIILDPGFGFAKNISQNFSLLKNLDIFTKHGFPVLAGLSRKSMIFKTLNTTPIAALNGTTALNMLALTKGAKILRVHDVKEAKETIELWKAYESA
jgi:dihydropteroate synthase